LSNITTSFTLFTIAVLESPVEKLEFDLEIKLSDSRKQLDEELLTVCYILLAQIPGFYESLNLDLKPDNPSLSGAISRVVENVTIYKY
jgi:tagatose-6-phosphate ketose/aldose isomerase